MRRKLRNKIFAEFQNYGKDTKGKAGKMVENNAKNYFFEGKCTTWNGAGGGGRTENGCDVPSL